MTLGKEPNTTLEYRNENGWESQPKYQIVIEHLLPSISDAKIQSPPAR